MSLKFFNPGILNETVFVQQNINDKIYAENSAPKAIHLFLGSGFGSPKHPTTRSCLKYMRELFAHASPAVVLDAGTGNAILAIAAAFGGAEKIIAVDILPSALKTARRNVILNSLQKRIQLCCADAFTLRGRYDLIIANLNPGCFDHIDGFLESRLIEGGYSIVSGLSGFEQDRIFRRLVKNGSFVVQKELWDSGWTTFLFEKVRILPPTI